jgi:hypothetical protein
VPDAGRPTIRDRARSELRARGRAGARGSPIERLSQPKPRKKKKIPRFLFPNAYCKSISNRVRNQNASRGKIHAKLKPRGLWIASANGKKTPSKGNENAKAGERKSRRESGRYLRTAPFTADETMNVPRWHGRPTLTEGAVSEVVFSEFSAPGENRLRWCILVTPIQ